MLYEQLKIRDVVLRNRIAVSPMCQFSSSDGFASDWHLVHLGSRAVGGAGLVIAEATAVEPRGRISAADLGLWQDGHIPMLKRITDFIHTQGAAAGIQLAHAGRKAFTAAPWEGGAPVGEDKGGWSPIVAPSPIPFDANSRMPKELTVKEIAGIVAAFAAAAKRALDAGFDVVELHAAHGYLLHEFLSPVTNKRGDDYGGSLENRARMVIDAVRAIRKVWPEQKPLFVRISATDWLDGDCWEIGQSVKLAGLLKTEGVDLIDVSSGAIVPYAKIPAGPGFQVPFAERIRRETGIMTGAVGLITGAAQAETILRTGQADMVLMAREFLRDPYFPLRAAKEVHAKQAWPKQYERAV
jgi:2,4-dienoyl-CoA reductase-like NADH-dependent reductase (Old Yellow Enzyme family)